MSPVVQWLLLLAVITSPIWGCLAGAAISKGWVVGQRDRWDAWCQSPNPHARQPHHPRRRPPNAR